MDYSKINFQPLFDWINTKIHAEVEFGIDITGKRPEIVSPNIVDYCGAFASVCESVEVGFFNFQVSKDGFWATVYLNYQSWSGGSNGMQIGDVYYDCANEQWDFVSTKQRTLTYRHNG